MYNLESEITRKPTIRNYDAYLRHGSAVETGQTTASEVGINGVWIFADLPYSSLLHPTKDIMHTEIYETLRNFLPTLVLRFLLDPNPLRFINHMP